MRRLGRYMLNALTLLSLLMFVASCAMWLRSAWAWDRLFWAETGGRLWSVESGGGQVRVSWARPWPNMEPVRWVTARADDYPPGPDTPPLGRRRFEARGWRGLAPAAGANTGSIRLDETGRAKWPMSNMGGLGAVLTSQVAGGWFRVPYVFISAPAAFLCVARRTRRAWRWRCASRRTANRLCVACGYDLRATPGRCPECGTAVKGAANDPPRRHFYGGARRTQGVRTVNSPGLVGMGCPASPSPHGPAE